jgi:hypothetical protein
MSAAMQTTTTEPVQPMTTTTAPAPALGAGDLEQRLAFCLSAAAVAGRAHPCIAAAVERYWLARPTEAAQLLAMHTHLVSSAAVGVVLLNWAGYGSWGQR